MKDVLFRIWLFINTFLWVFTAMLLVPFDFGYWIYTGKSFLDLIVKKGIESEHTLF